MDRSKWQDDFIIRQTKSLVTKSTNHLAKLIIKLKWIWKNQKMKIRLLIRKQSNRLVAKVMLRKRVIDFEDPFAPVARFGSSFWNFVAHAAHKSFQSYQMDVKTHFLMVPTEGRGLRSQEPEGFIDPYYPEKSYLLRKACYGLKASSKRPCHKVVRLGINPMIQPEPEDLPKDNPKLEIAVLRSHEELSSMNSLRGEGCGGRIVSAHYYESIKEARSRVQDLTSGEIAFISKIGNLKLSNVLILYDVLVIPEYCVTLISVHKLAKENKIIVAFDESRCYFLNQDLNLRNIMGIANQCEGLYYYKDHGIKSNHSVLDYKCYLSQHDWHCKLGHHAEPILNVLKGSLQINNMDKNVYCETYQRAKQTREPFPLSDLVSKYLGYLVHLDLLGPYKVTSSEGFRYFLTIVDDYTRAVWVLKGKVKVFRSDNETEFINQTVNGFCANKEIIHQTSCAYTPQQNGIAERKHMHLLNVARSFMFQGGIPLMMWTECILTATYLINMLPPYVLNGKSPYEMIYKKAPSLFHLRVFGCLYFATIVNNNDKFGSRSEKCVMIGYSNFKKGYKLYSLDKHQFIFSRDVKFFETVFPFKDSIAEKNDSNVFKDLNHEYLELPNDDERVEPRLNTDQRLQSSSSSSSVPGEDAFTADFLVKSGNDADSSDDIFATQDKEVTTLEENIFSKDNLDQNPSSSPQGVQNVRRSSRQSVFPRNYNDFVVDSKVKYRIEKYVGYSNLNTENYCFVTQLNKNYEPKSFSDASKYPHLTDAMNQVMDVLLRNGTWEIMELPKDRKAIGSKWIFKIKYRSNREVDRYKAILVAQGFGQKEETAYMRPREGYFPSGFSQSKSNYSLYTKSDKGVFLALLVYVDDIIITGNSVSKIEKFKGICLNQRKYVLDLLSEYGMLACKPATTPLMSKLIISNEASEKDPILDNITDYQKLMGKLIYLTNTRHDISYVVHCLSQFMHSLLKSHLKIAFKILRYLKSCPGLGIHIIKTSGMFVNAYCDAD
ncbi:putative RNA-directed DNA polymerase [Tanacetum coccineum]